MRKMKQSSSVSNLGKLGNSLRDMTKIQDLHEQTSFSPHMCSLACRKAIAFLYAKSSVICFSFEVSKIVQGTGS